MVPSEIIFYDFSHNYSSLLGEKSCITSFWTTNLQKIYREYASKIEDHDVEGAYNVICISFLDLNE